MANEKKWLSFSPAYCVFLAMLLLAVPMQWCFAVLSAIILHELGHLAVIWIAAAPVGGTRLQLRGAAITLPPMSRGAELLCACAGPAVSLSLLLLARWLPRLAVCGALQGLYNLLPVYPLDGGRILCCIQKMVFSPPVAEKIQAVVEFLVFLLLSALAIYAICVLEMGFFPLLLLLNLLLQKISAKRPCKPAHLRVK